MPEALLGVVGSLELEEEEHANGLLTEIAQRHGQRCCMKLHLFVTRLAHCSLD